jgi:hypothetical protein
MEDWIFRVLAADAKKAGSANEATLLIPRPPNLIGSEA